MSTEADGRELSGKVKWEDSRANAKPEDIVFRNLHNFRRELLSQGVVHKNLTDTQWGLVPLDRCHHISITASGKDGPQSYRVRICKTCCQENCHIELGTYADQESAILVNDAFEIMNNRYDKLLVLRAEDNPFLHMLTAKKVDRTKGKDYASVLDLIAERTHSNTPSIESRKRKSPSVHSDVSYPRKQRLSMSSSVCSDSSPGRPSPSEGLSDSEDTTTKQSQSEGSDTTQSSAPPSAQFQPVPSLAPSIPLLSQPNFAHSTATPTFTRMRSFTFSTSADYSPSNRFNSLYSHLHANKTPIDTLTWLASLEDDEVDVAKSLFALRSGPVEAGVGASLGAFDSGEGRAAQGTGAGVGDGMEGEEGTVAEKLLMLSSAKKGAPSSALHTRRSARTARSGQGEADEEGEEADEDDDDDEEAGVHGRELDDDGYDDEDDEDDHSMSYGRGEYDEYEEDILDRRRHSSIHALANKNIMANNLRGRRGRANSMSVLERPIMGVLPVSFSLNCPGSPTGRSKDPLAIVLKKFADRGSLPGKGYIGIYSPEDRKARIDRFFEKRKNRIWAKKVKYDVRKNFADSRIRVKGRFVKKDEEQAAIVMAFTEKVHRASVTGNHKHTGSSSTSQVYIPKSASKHVLGSS